MTRRWIIPIAAASLVTACSTSSDDSTTSLGGTTATTLAARDTTPPEVSTVEVAPLIVDRGTDIRVVADVGDPSGVRSVAVTVTMSGTVATWCDAPATFSGPDGVWELWEVNCTVPNEAATGTYSIEITVEDDLGNRDTLTGQATFEVVGSDPTGPTIGGVSAAPATAGSDIALGADVTDTSGVAGVTYSIVDVSSGIEVGYGSMSANGGRYTATATLAAGDYYIVVDAIDAFTNSTTSNPVFFTVG